MVKQNGHNVPMIPVDLPEELELTEHEWYEYHYHLARNRFLLQKILALPVRPRRIYILEPFPSYLDQVLEKLGFEVDCEWIYPSPYHPLAGEENAAAIASPGEGGYDLIILLNALENQSGHPQTYLVNKSVLLAKGGFLFLLTENLTQFRNRLKILLGHSPFTAVERLGVFHYRALGLSDLRFILSNSGWEMLEYGLIAPYPPFRMESLTLGRYLLKHFNHLAMKLVPGFRNLIFIQARKN